MQKQLQHKQVELVQSEKMASLGRLAAGVAHEINNPLSGVLIYANLALEDMTTDSPLSDDIKRVISETTRCKEIVRELLDFARQDESACDVVDVNMIIEDGIRLIQNQATFHNIKIDLDLQKEIPPVNASGIRLNQVFLNLYLNAVEAMGGNGCLHIKTEANLDEQKVKITVSDDGVGIPDDIQTKIFEPFFTTKEVGKGTGLGLSVSYGIVQECGGYIEVKSEPKKGACFTIELPAVQSASRDARAELA